MKALARKPISIALILAIAVSALVPLLYPTFPRAQVSALMPNTSGQAKVKEDVRVQAVIVGSGKKDIAVIDGDEKSGIVTVELLFNLLNLTSDYYSNCTTLGIYMDRGIRYKIYIVDVESDGGELFGIGCVKSIQTQHPGALVLVTTADQIPQKLNLGEKGVFFKGVMRPQELIQMVSTLLKIVPK